MCRNQDIPVYLNEKDGVRAKVISGTAFGQTGPVVSKSPIYYIDFTLKKGAQIEQVIPAGWNSMLVLFGGSLNV